MAPAHTVLHLEIGGMSCASCSAAVTRALHKVPGVAEASVNFADESARVVVAAKDASGDPLVRAVEQAGYRAHLRTTEVHRKFSFADEEAARAKRRFLLAALLTIPVVLAMVMAPRGTGSLWVQGVCAGLVLLGPGRSYFVSAWRSLGSLSPNMDVLIALGTSACYLYSLLSSGGWLGDAPVFFESAAFLVTFVSLGKWLEARARGTARAALLSLLDLTPQEARILVEDNERAIPARDLRPGMRLVVLPGERLAADGVLRAGATTVDESMLTGEAVPVEKETWDRVTGGTLNQIGRIEVEVTAAGQDTVIAEIIRMVRDAQAHSAPIQRLADRVAGIFVPAVIVLSALTGVFWAFVLGARFFEAFSFAVAVVVIACPCALGLATPTAILVGSALGLRHGILLKNGAALEVLGRIRSLLIDKTGTITTGHFEVIECHPATGIDEHTLLSYAAALERGSAHPLAQAVVTRAEERGLPRRSLDNLEERRGLGVEGRVGGKSVVLGRWEFLRERGVDDCSDAADESGDNLPPGLARISVAIDSTYAGDIWLADEIRPEAREVIAALSSHGIETVLVTGDRRQAAEWVASRVGISRVHAGVRPGEKKAIVERERSRGPVAFVGDGINDAPALATADVGVAIGSGTDAAKETGDIVLVRPNLHDLLRCWRLSRATLKRVRQNLFWAFLYNVTGIPIAAGALSTWGLTLRPEIAGLAMALSSASVVANSLLLRREEPVIFR